MKAKVVGYWVCTVLIALSFLSGGVVDLLRPHDALEGMAHLGYPAYFMLILGVWKILGGVALVIPRYPVLKEWAYAGIIFDLTGASVSHIYSGDDVRHILTPLILVGLTMASWALRPESRKVMRLVPAQVVSSRG